MLLRIRVASKARWSGKRNADGYTEEVIFVIVALIIT